MLSDGKLLRYIGIHQRSNACVNLPNLMAAHAYNRKQLFKATTSDLLAFTCLQHEGNIYQQMLQTTILLKQSSIAHKGFSNTINTVHQGRIIT